MSDDRLRAAVALYDRYTHEGMDRRLFMAELTRIAGGAAAASLLLSGIAANAQAAPQVAADDARLRTAMLRFDEGPDRLSYYSAAPARWTSERRPAVFVIHENRGLNEHIRDVARRLALAGYLALAPDFLSLDGGATPGNEDQARAAIGALDMRRAVAGAVALIEAYHAPDVRVNRSTPPYPVGAVGFCWGGAMVNRLAVAAGDALAAGVSFYGPAPDPAEAARVRAAMLIITAGLDQRVNATARPWVAALNAAGRTVRAIEYPNVDHAFHNDTSAARYNAEAAQQAWAATLSWFRRHLEGRGPFH